MERLPVWIKRLGAKSIQAFPPQYWDQLSYILPKCYRNNLFGDKLYKLADVLKTRHGMDFYRSLVSMWEQPATLVKGGLEIVHNVHANEGGFDGNFVERLQKIDTLTYLPDDILAKVDRASMAVGLEARVPLLDHRVIEFAWQLPFNYKIRNGQGKWLLRQVLNRYVPRPLIERPKMGFGVPIDKWLRGPLKEWAETLLAEDRLQQECFLNPIPIRKRWLEHQQGTRNWQYSLWGVLMFQTWKEHWQQ
jgi:asparagine synthase (glutamine-hydrolysing)